MAFLWEAYLDESETGDPNKNEGRVYTVACLLAPSAIWERFSAAWAEAMMCCGAEGKVLHMKALLHGQRGSEWEGWTEGKRRLLFEKLVSVIREHRIMSYCGSIPLDLYERIYAGVNAASDDGPITPYQLILQGTIESIMDSQRMVTDERLRVSKGNPIAFFMESNQVLQGDLTKQFFSLVQWNKWEDTCISLVPIPKGPAPLQLADMVAYEGSTDSSRHKVGQSVRKPRGLFQVLEALPGFVFRTADRVVLDMNAHDLWNRADNLTPEEDAATRANYERAGRRAQQVLSKPRVKRKDEDGGE